MPRNKKGKNPLLAAAILTPTVGTMLSKTKSPKSSSRESKRSQSTRALVPYGTPAVVDRVRSRLAAMQTAATSASSLVMPAPVAAGMMMRGANYQFGAAPPRGGCTGIRLTGRQLWAQLGVSGMTASSTNVLGQYTNGAWTSTVHGLSFDPDDIQTMPPPITSLSQVFMRYCLRKCRLVYTPSSATSSAVSVAFAVFTDASFGLSAISPSTFTQIMEQSNSTAGPVWGMFSIDVPCDDELRYTYQSVGDGTLTVAEGRQDHAFSLVAATNSSISSVQGYLHMEYVLDLYEVIVQGNEGSLLRRLARLKQQSHVERKEETPARDEEKAPISSSLGLSPQVEVPGGWSLVPSGFRGVSFAARQEPPTPPPVKAQSLKS